MVTKIAVFASGSGSNFEAIVEAVINKKIKNAEITLLLTDKENIYALERAKKYNIKTVTHIAKNFETKKHYEKEVLKTLKEEKIDFIVLAGYMLLIGETLLNVYEGKIINIHPSILPAFKGKDAIKMALDYGVKYTGVSIHWVDSGMDTGKIIDQEVVKIDDNENYETLAQKIHKVEHKLYPEVINRILNKE